MDSSGTFSYEERVRLYYSYIRYWMAVLDHFKPDVVFFPVAPHLMYNYVLYELCKRKHIKTMMFEVSSFSKPLIYPVEQFECGSNAIKSMYDNLLKSHNEEVKDVSLSDDVEKHLKKILGDYSEATPSYIKEYLDKQQVMRFIAKRFAVNPYDLPKMVRKAKFLYNKEHYVKQNRKNIAESDVRGLRYLFCILEGINKKKKLSRHYKKLTRDVDLNCPYIYVPLHYQPERTTSPEGNIFVDQRLMVDLLSKCIPEDWSIYVKEHPMQSKAISSHGECSRTIDFYDELVSIPNVKIIPTSTLTFSLSDHAKAVATVTGTVGWETVLRGKPVLMFGHAWYRNCEGVFYTPTEEACRAAISKIQAGYKVDKKKVRLFIHVLEQVSVIGYLEPNYVKMAGISYEDCHEENVSTLTDTIQRFYTQITSKA
jgi:hypothetical protein